MNLKDMSATLRERGKRKIHRESWRVFFAEPQRFHLKSQVTVWFKTDDFSATVSQSGARDDVAMAPGYLIIHTLVNVQYVFLKT